MRRSPRRWWLLASIAVAASLGTTVAADFGKLDRQWVGQASVIDGDTIEIGGQRIRLYGIDAPERAQLCLRSDGTRWRCGEEAARALRRRIAKARLVCREMGRDFHGRVIALCRVGSQDLSAWLVHQGWAVASPYDTDYYRPFEAEARARKQNIWSGPFAMPWDWRQARQGLGSRADLEGEPP